MSARGVYRHSWKVSYHVLTLRAVRMERFSVADVAAVALVLVLCSMGCFDWVEPLLKLLISCGGSLRLIEESEAFMEYVG